jgi:hypothetical protein
METDYGGHIDPVEILILLIFSANTTPNVKRLQAVNQGPRWGLIDETNRGPKISWNCPFKPLPRYDAYGAKSKTSQLRIYCILKMVNQEVLYIVCRKKTNFRKSSALFFKKSFQKFTILVILNLRCSCKGKLASWQEPLLSILGWSHKQTQNLSSKIYTFLSTYSAIFLVN